MSQTRTPGSSQEPAGSAFSALQLFVVKCLSSVLQSPAVTLRGKGNLKQESRVGGIYKYIFLTMFGTGVTVISIFVLFSSLSSVGVLMVSEYGSDDNTPVMRHECECF